eukprot:scaffold20174_cov42-Phaeocystis_antarctica.AAC.2
MSGAASPVRQTSRAKTTRPLLRVRARAAARAQRGRAVRGEGLQPLQGGVDLVEAHLVRVNWVRVGVGVGVKVGVRVRVRASAPRRCSHAPAVARRGLGLGLGLGLGSPLGLGLGLGLGAPAVARRAARAAARTGGRAWPG